MIPILYDRYDFNSFLFPQFVLGKDKYTLVKVFPGIPQYEGDNPDGGRLAYYVMDDTYDLIDHTKMYIFFHCALDEITQKRIDWARKNFDTEFQKGELENLQHPFSRRHHHIAPFIYEVIGENEVVN